VTVDEELNKLEDDIRRLKVEYEIYFNGSSPRPPHDTLYRVETTVKRYSSDQSKLNFSQRYRFTSLVQKFAVNNQLWRRKLQEKEEGRSLTGVPRRAAGQRAADGVVRVVCSNPEAEPEKVAELLRAMEEAKNRAHEPEKLDAAAFQKLILSRTQQIKTKLGCDKVLFSVSVEDGKAKLKAAKAE
jgi:hypothetical protein